jgi:hypothetical protein
MSHHVTFKDLPEGGEKFDPAKGSKLIGAFAVIGGLGLAGSIYGFSANSDTFSYSWLFAIFFAFTVMVGGCFWILLHSASNSSWGVAMRRYLGKSGEHGASPPDFGAAPAASIRAEHLYEWMNHHREAATHAANTVARSKKRCITWPKPIRTSMCWWKSSATSTSEALHSAL